jgi:ankyrin repeat protein
LHWMAKYGNDAMVHLLIGRYRMNPNIRTRGGYTPLMLAAMHRKENVYNLLLKPYGAEPNLRDYSGKKAEHYLPPEVLDEKEDEDEPDSKRKAKIDRSSTFLRDFVRESKRGLSRPKTQNL